MFSWLVAWLFVVTIVTGQSAIPDCFQACVLDWCTDITHLNCICIQQAPAIKACFSQSCNSTDVTLSQQFDAQYCGIISVLRPTNIDSPCNVILNQYCFFHVGIHLLAHTSTSATAVSSSSSNPLSVSSGSSSLVTDSSTTITSPTSEPSTHLTYAD